MSPREKIIRLVEEKRILLEIETDHHRQIMMQVLTLKEIKIFVAQDFLEHDELAKIAEYFQIDLEELKGLDIEDFLILQEAFEGEL